MKQVAVLMLLLGLTGVAQAQSRKAPPAAGETEITVEGELENWIAIGGETTGWRLRTRTPEGRRRYVEVLLTAEIAQGVRAGQRVQVRGAMKTRHYVERGDVDVLVAKSVIEVPVRR